MIDNPVIQAMMNRKSIRNYKEERPSAEVIETVVRAGQQAPFAMQLGSVLLAPEGAKNPFNAPLFFLILFDCHRYEKIMAARGWTMEMDDLSLLIFGIQDASYMAQNMVIAAESLGMGSCYLGVYPFIASTMQKRYNLPDRIYPVVGLTMGYPAEDPPVRPRYPREFHLFEGSYPELTAEMVATAMQEMDEGYLAQDYYRKDNIMIPLKGTKEETFTYDTYSWTEHISRKGALYTEMKMRPSFEKVGFTIPAGGEEELIDDEE